MDERRDVREAEGPSDEKKQGPLYYAGRLGKGALQGVLLYVAVIGGIVLLLVGIGRARSCGKAEAVQAVEEVAAGEYALGERVTDETYHYSYQPLAGSVKSSDKKGMLSYTSSDPAMTFVGFSLVPSHGGDVQAEAERAAGMLEAEVASVGESDFVLKSAEADDKGRVRYVRGIVSAEYVYGLVIEYAEEDAAQLEPYAAKVAQTLEPGDSLVSES